jgi:hypothetical protein
METKRPVTAAVMGVAMAVHRIKQFLRMLSEIGSRVLADQIQLLMIHHRHRICPRKMLESSAQDSMFEAGSQI